MKKFLLILGTCLVLLAITGFVFRNAIFTYVANNFFSDKIDSFIMSVIDNGTSVPETAPSPNEPDENSPDDSGNVDPVVEQLPVGLLDADLSKVSKSDREKALDLLLSKFSAAEIAQFSKEMTGGLTAANKNKYKKLLAERFSPEEVEEIREMYERYK